MATTFISVSSGFTCAPLNPSYRAPEYEFYLSDLNAKALIVEKGSDSPAIAVAQELNIPIVWLSETAVAGQFILESNLTQHGIAKPKFAKQADTALVLHTSGTTSRPKIVPLAHQNIMASARNIGQTLHLTPNDRCLNIMPLFHIHGLMAAVLSSFSAGASIVLYTGILGSKIL